MASMLLTKLASIIWCELSSQVGLQSTVPLSSYQLLRVHLWDLRNLHVVMGSTLGLTPLSLEFRLVVVTLENMLLDKWALPPVALQRQSVLC